jgi:hypothetical protein
MEREDMESAKRRAAADWKHIVYLTAMNAELLKALDECKRELWHCNKQLTVNGWTEGATVKKALENAEHVIARATRPQSVKA